MPKTLHFVQDEWVRIKYPAAEYPGWQPGDELPQTLSSASGTNYKFTGTATVTDVAHVDDTIMITVFHRKT